MTIPTDLRTAGVMLASPGKNPDALLAQMLTEPNRWSYEIKADGMRTLVYIDGGKAWLRSRQGEDMHQYPEIIAYLQETFPTESMVFDAEMLCFDPATRAPTFNRIQRRHAQSNTRSIATLSESMPATLMVFDLLCDRGADTRRIMQQGRRLLLEKVAERFDNKRLMLSPASDDGQMMWDFVAQHKLEGLIAKRKADVYTARRDSGWVKLKPVQSLTAVAYDWENGKAGKARANGVGAIFILLHDGVSTTPIGKVGTGFTMRDLVAIENDINAWKADPVNAPPVLVEIEYQEVTPDKKLRFPSYKGRRDDVTWDACRIEQLEVTS